LVFACLVAGIVGAAVVFRPAGDLYQSVAIKLQPVSVTVTASGRVKPTRNVDLHALRAGQVESIAVDVNTIVKEGQILARLSASAESALVEAAEAAYSIALAQREIRALGVEKARESLAKALAERGVPEAHAEDLLAELSFAAKDLRRKRDLRTRGIVSAHDLEKAQSHYDAVSAKIKGTTASKKIVISKIAEARAQLRIAAAQVKEAEAAVIEKLAHLKEAEAALERSIIRSPIDGLVIDRAVEPGESVSNEENRTPLFQVVGDLQRIEIHAQVDETDIGRIRAGQEVTFTVDAYPQRQFRGKVLEMHRAPLLVQNVVTYRVVISATNTDLALLPGMTAIVRILVEETEAVMTVPNAALRFHAQMDNDPENERLRNTAATPDEGMEVGYIWIRNDFGPPRRVTVRLGAANDFVTEISAKGLGTNDQVIVGYQHIEAGS
jgi:HlyD family secretion protein